MKKIRLQVAAVEMSQGLYFTLKCWMEDICLPLTLPRKVFLRRFDALLTLRGFSTIDFRSVQSAMEILLNNRKDSHKQKRYRPGCIGLVLSLHHAFQVPRDNCQTNQQMHR
jgi:hypothetical protein